MKKIVFSLILMVCLLAAAKVEASIITFDDLIDTWGNAQIDARPILEGSPFTYTHDINDQVNLALGHEVLDATLELDFTNDSGDSVIRIFSTVIFDGREFVRVGVDGDNNSIIDATNELGDVDNTQYSWLMDVDWLNDDGELDVTLRVYNSGPNAALAWLDHSRLYGHAKTSTPEPASMLLFGSGLVGLIRKRMQK